MQKGKVMTRSKVRAKLLTAKELANKLEKTLQEIQSGLNYNHDTDAIIDYWIDKICSFEPADVDEIMEDFEEEECFLD